MMRRAYGVDLGTSVIKIYKKGKGIVCNQKNIIAFENDNVLATGDDAFAMYEKVPENVRVTYPIKNGVIADIASMEKLFSAMIKELSKNGKMHNAEYLIALPMNITEVEKRAFIDLVDASRARKVRTVAKPIAAAVGAGIDVSTAKGAMIVDVGASTTEIAVISLGGIVISKLLPIGGESFNDSIISAVKKQYNLLIGSKTASRLKKVLGNMTKVSENIYAIDDKNEELVEKAKDGDVVDNSIAGVLEVPGQDVINALSIYGRDILTGLPQRVIIDSCLVVDAMQETLDSIVEGIKLILERTPPEIASDIIDTGIYVVGGCATIRGIDELIRDNTGLKVNVSKNPANIVVNGIGTIMESPVLSKMVCKNVK